MGGRNPTRAKQNLQQQQGKRRIEQGREKSVFWWDCAKNGVCRCWWVVMVGLNGKSEQAMYV
jgi:hypothetical protein